jgi:hypothetical protein
VRKIDADPGCLPTQTFMVLLSNHEQVNYLSRESGGFRRAVLQMRSQKRLLIGEGKHSPLAFVEG